MKSNALTAFSMFCVSQFEYNFVKYKSKHVFLYRLVTFG
jgi:hypothetical protein